MIRVQQNCLIIIIIKLILIILETVNLPFLAETEYQDNSDDK